MNHYDVYLVDTQILSCEDAVAGTEADFVSEFSFSTDLEAEAFILGISVADRYQEGEIRGFRTRWEALAHAKVAIEANLHPYDDENGYQ